MQSETKGSEVWVLTRLETNIFVRQSSRSYTMSDREFHLILFEKNPIGNFAWISHYGEYTPIKL